MPDENKIKAVYFDLGETLLNFGRVDVLKLFGQGAKNSYDFIRSTGHSAGNFACYYLKSLLTLHAKRALSYVTGSDFDSLEVLKKIAEKS